VRTKTKIEKSDVESFRGRCIYARALYSHHCYLFDNKNDPATQIKQEVRLFFGDICAALRDQIILQVCTLTDLSVQGRRQNLSLQFFIENSDFESTRIPLIYERILKFREIIKPARNKFISHFDLESTRAAKPLGVASRELWNQFWIDLQEFVNILSKELLNQPNLQINAISNTDLPKLVAGFRGRET
jgi:hypothetical protein